MEIECTIVFEKIWDAIFATEDDGQRKYRYIILTGSSRSSKTVSTIDALDLYARMFKEKRQTIWRETKKDCKDTVLVDMLKRLRSTGRFNRKQFNKTESYYEYDTDSRTEIRGTDEEGIFGLTQQVAWFNEPYSITRDDFDQIDQRTEDFIIIDWNPKQQHWIYDLAKHPRAIVIHSTFKDNPFCPEESRLKILGYEPVPQEHIRFENYVDEQLLKADISTLNDEDQYAIMRGWTNTRNKTANRFKWNVYGLGIQGEVEGLCIPNYKLLDEVHPGATLYGYGLDFGYTNHPSTLVALWVFKNMLILDEVFYSTGMKNSMIAARMEKENIRKTELVIPDSAEPKSIDDIYDFGFSNVHGAKKGPDSIRYGIGLMTDEKYELCITKRSENLKFELDNYKNAKDKFGKFINEPEKNQQDHAIDAGRYIITDYCTRVPFFVK